jgi:hypothetical protein
MLLWDPREKKNANSSHLRNHSYCIRGYFFPNILKQKGLDTIILSLGQTDKALECMRVFGWVNAPLS